MGFTAEEKVLRDALREDFEFYSEQVLKIRTKSQGVMPFAMNDAQRYVHAVAEKQLKEKGYIRIVVLKGRQMGLSTYIEGRFYWKVSHKLGVRAYILTHESNATDNLFSMVERYHDHCLELVKPPATTKNAKELHFGNLDSGYKVGTAGNKEVGRSDTIQFLHGSEVASWANADEIASGLMNAVPKGEDAQGTEVWLESTAKGVGDYFHSMWRQAEEGRSAYIPVFVPWFWDKSYTTAPPINFKLTEEEQDYADTYLLTMGQMAWRREQIIEGGGSVEKFQREYPATAAEAFAASSDKTLIELPLVMRARKQNKEVVPFGAMVLGVDVARFGDDRTVLCLRQGRVVHWTKAWEKQDTMATVGLVVHYAKQFRPRRIFVDVVGVGAGVVDRLRETEFAEAVCAVNGAEAAIDQKKYRNRRAEIWCRMRDWFLDSAVKIPDDDVLAADLTGLLYSYDSSDRYVLEKKEDAKKRGIRSPDMGDALALTFAAPVGTIAGNSFEPSVRTFALQQYQSFEPEHV